MSEDVGRTGGRRMVSCGRGRTVAAVYGERRVRWMGAGVVDKLRAKAGGRRMVSCAQGRTVAAVYGERRVRRTAAGVDGKLRARADRRRMTDDG